MLEPNFENYWPRTSRENYLHQSCLQLFDCIEDLEEERDNLLSVRNNWWSERSQFSVQREELYSQISIRDEIINDLKLKLQEEHELAEDWKERMLEERKLKIIAKEDWKLDCERKNNLMKQFDALLVEVEDLNYKLTIVTCEKNNLIKRNEALTNDIILEKDKFKNYEILKVEKMNEIKEVTVSMCNELKYLKGKFFIINTTLRNAKHNIEAFNIKLKTHNNLQQYKAKNLILLIILAILQSIHTYIKEKKNIENIIRLKNPLLCMKIIKENNLDNT